MGCGSISHCKTEAYCKELSEAYPGVDVKIYDGWSQEMVLQIREVLRLLIIQLFVPMMEAGIP